MSTIKERLKRITQAMLDDIENLPEGDKTALFGAFVRAEKGSAFVRNIAEAGSILDGDMDYSYDDSNDDRFHEAG